MRSLLEWAWSSVEIVSPHDPEARLGHKPGKVEWVGYKDHQTETCDEERPNLIVHVVTTPAPEQDIGVVGGIHAALAGQQLAPGRALCGQRLCHTRDGSPRGDRSRNHHRRGRSVRTPAPSNGPASPRRTSTSIGKPRLLCVHKG
jgi:hypothetical protein